VAPEPSTAANAATPDPAASDANVPKPASEITAVRVGTSIVYRYKDANGHVVLLDQPPRGYAATKFENMAPPVADAPAPAQTMEATAPAVSGDAGESLIDGMLRLVPWLVLAALVALAVVLGLPRLIWSFKRRLARHQSLASVLDRSGYDTMHGVILPLAGGRTAFFDHIVRTPSGLIVVGSERTGVDNAHGGATRESRPAPVLDRREMNREVANLDARVEAVKALAPGVPVFGRFVCTGTVPADGAAPRVVPLPRFVQTLPEFRRLDAVHAAALNAAWQTLRIRAGRDEKTPPGSAGNKNGQRPSPTA
jgi:hypothetical protein